MFFKSYILIFLLFFTAGVVSAQSAAESKPTPVATKANSDADLVLEIISERLSARLYAMDSTKNRDKSGASKNLADLYAKAIQRPGAMRLLVGDAYSDYLQMKEGARSAPQVSQAADESSVSMNLIIVAQNQRIIELLEQLVKKK